MSAHEVVARRFSSVAAVLLLGVLAGCRCGSSARGDSGADAGAADSAASDAAGLDGAVGCGDPTGEGCVCAKIGSTRSCTTGGTGACGMGTQTCVEGKLPVWGPCGDVPAPSAELCDGVDNDCNGMDDDGLGTLSCGLGVCVVEAPACAGGVNQTCVPGTPGSETCNGLDDDCNGMDDDGLDDLVCGVGACAATTPACAGGIPQTCVPGMAGTESCNGIDDDCDAMTDEGLGNANCGTGECEVTVAACTGGSATPCTPGMPSAEVCDALDNDCNGIIDDGFGTVTCGTGECEVTVLDCTGSGGGMCTPGTPVPETCNGLDDDCDGTDDDGIVDVTCGTGACARIEPGCTGGVPGVCTPGIPTPEACDGVDNNCNGSTDEGIPDLVCGVGACQQTAVACTGGVPGTCTAGMPGMETCGNLVDDDCDGSTDELCGCDPAIDNDFDGYNQCTDCDDTNGAVFPTQTEICNGADDDCDGLIDETFDGDGDGYGTCSTDPYVLDCDDADPLVNPGATEDCGPAGMGNGVDDDCDGYVDELCAPCSAVDGDGDLVSECMGDCDDTDPLVAPGFFEVCEGVDTDCNVYTTDNCDVSEPCNFPSSDDVCMEDLLCACIAGPSGMCTVDYVCSSFCSGSYTGPLGAGCTATQTCRYRLTLSDNQHACAETTATLGGLGAGEVCSADSDCRSNECGGDPGCFPPGAPACSTDFCQDWCDHHDPGAGGSCAPGTVCEIELLSSVFGAFTYARCHLDNNGTGDTGDACTGAGSTPCMWGTASCVSGICAEPCGTDAHCDPGYHCSLLGNQVTVATWGAGAPSYLMGEDAIETVPVCLADTGAGLHDRQAGAACGQNGDCESQFCEATLGVCASLCTTDADCPTGLTCETAYVRTPASTGGVTFARLCLSAPGSMIIESM